MTSANALPGVADTPVEAPGKVAGVTGAEAAEAGPVPAGLEAVTEKVYEVPLPRPDTVHESAPLVVQVLPSGELVTVYLMKAEPPSEAGVVHETRAEALPAVAATPRAVARCTRAL